MLYIVLDDANVNQNEIKEKSALITLLPQKQFHFFISLLHT